MSFHFPDLLSSLMVMLIVGAALLLSTMSIKKGPYSGTIIIDTDTRQKNKIRIAYIIIDITVFVVYIVAFIYTSYSWIGVIGSTLGLILYIRNFVKHRNYEFYTDWFADISQKLNRKAPEGFQKDSNKTE